jgi:CBS domain-containing protein
MSSHLPPASQTPLIALPVVSLDLETTGLDVRRDRVIQVGLVAMQGGMISDAPRVDLLVDPEMPIPNTASRITGITDHDVIGAPKIAAVLEQLNECMEGRVVVGHHIAFDLAVLRHEAERVGAAWTEPPSLDVGHVLGALEPSLPDLGFERVLSSFGVNVEGRHSGIGDSLAVAEVFGHLIERLRDRGVKTFGEACALAARRSDIVQGEVQAGWHAALPGAQISSSEVRIDAYAFSRSLADVMSAPPTFVLPDETLMQAAERMVADRIGALLVGAPTEAPQGIATERDVLRAFVERAGDAATLPVSSVMSAPVAALPPGELLYRALARMDRLGVRHLCVSDEQGMAVGIVSQRDLLHHRARGEAVVDDMVSDAVDSSALALAFSRVATVAGGMVSEGLEGKAVARVVSRELRSVTARAADIAADRLESEGKGLAPAPWCLLVLGSGGRGESLLSADQDNALIHAGAVADDEWFAAFGKEISDVLHDAGVPYCDGGVMAANAGWRGTREQWRDRIEHWLERARPEDLLNVDIFFDLRPVAGDRSLGEGLLADAVSGASRSKPFLGLMAQSVAQLAPNFGLFHRPRLAEGRQDLKRDALLPIVSFARAMALRIGSTARATADRIGDVAAAGKIGEGDAAKLIRVHERALNLILLQQLEDLRNGVRSSSRVDMRVLPRGERKALMRELSDLGEITRDIRSLIS